MMEHEVYQILEKYKIPVPRWKLAKTREETVSFAKKIGYPVVMKIVSKHILHKTDVGGVLVGISREEDVQKGFDNIMKSVKRKVPKAKLEGVLVYKMVKSGEEVVIGGAKDPQFGQTIMFGAGGVLVEIMGDTSFRIVPIDKSDAEEMIKETKISRVLSGHRGKSYDTKAVIDILLKASKLLQENQIIKELDLNPIEVLNKGAYPVDARIILE